MSAETLRAYGPSEIEERQVPLSSFRPNGHQAYQEGQTDVVGGISMTPEELVVFHGRALELLLELITPDGSIPASKDPRFHHKFARDTFISAKFALEGLRYSPNHELWTRIKKAVFNFWNHQLGNGQFPHEVKPYSKKHPKKFYHRVGDLLINDDSVDATPLALIVTPMFIEDKDELERIVPKAEKALDWMLQNMDAYNGWLGYKYNRGNGGLVNQGWMDSAASIKWRSIRFPKDPIALVEVQGYAWKALRVWADILNSSNPQRSQALRERAKDLKERFNRDFVMEDKNGIYFAHALDGNGDRIESISINPGLCLWASYNGESIFQPEYVPAVVERLMSDDMFDEEAGIRTFARGQTTFDPTEYHSGQDVYWPVATYMVADGMMRYGFANQARQAMRAPRVAIKYFGSFIEQFKRSNGRFSFFQNGHEKACADQTWTLAGFFWESSMSLSKTFRENE